MFKFSCILLLVVLQSALSAQSKAPADKADPPHPSVAARLVAEQPRGVNQMSWMVPPTPAPFNWNPDAPMEHAWEVTHIHFNHKAGHATDGMDIRWSEKHPLDSGGSKPEYDVEANRNDPVAYLGGTKPTVKVRIEAKDFNGGVPFWLAEAIVWAEATTTDGSFMSLEHRTVEFFNGISFENGSEFVEFQTFGSVPKMFGEYTVRYRWWISDPKDWGGMACDLEGWPVVFDETSRIDVYSTIGAPTRPSHLGPRTRPWATALAFACYPCGAADEGSITEIGDRITKHLHSSPNGEGHGVFYDQVVGGARYIEDRERGLVLADDGQSFRGTFLLSEYLILPQIIVACNDQCLALSSLMTLCVGGPATGRLLYRFGYINTRKLAGGTDANNPFWMRPGIFANPVVNPDHWYTDANNDGLIDRSFYEYHAYVVINSSVGAIIGDAAIGPVLPSTGLDATAYINQVRDASTQPETIIVVRNAQGNPVWTPVAAPSDSLPVLFIIK